MPTDEQRMREAFEKVRVAEYDIRWIDRDPATGEYARLSTYEAWGNFIEGWLARDAEVQALRAALEKAVQTLKHLKAERELKQAESGSSGWASIDMALAALAGGETGETE